MSTQNEIIWQESQYRIVRRVGDNALLAEVRGHDALENETWRKHEDVEALLRRATLWLCDRVRHLEATTQPVDENLKDFARGCDEVDARKRETEKRKSVDVDSWAALDQRTREALGQANACIDSYKRLENEMCTRVDEVRGMVERLGDALHHTASQADNQAEELENLTKRLTDLESANHSRCLDVGEWRAAMKEQEARIKELESTW